MSGNIIEFLCNSKSRQFNSICGLCLLTTSYIATLLSTELLKDERKQDSYECIYKQNVKEKQTLVKDLKDSLFRVLQKEHRLTFTVFESEPETEMLQHNKLHSSCGQLREQQDQCSALAAAIYNQWREKSYLSTEDRLNQI